MKIEIEKLEEGKKEFSEKMNSGNLSNEELITAAQTVEQLSKALDEKILKLLELEEILG